MSKAKAPAYNAKSITIRSINPNYRDGTDRFWFNNNPFVTHLINTLSFQFPSGEEQFVKSVAYFKDQIKDPELRNQIKGFMAQESLHGKVHAEFNTWVASLVPEAEDYCRAIAKRHREKNQKLIDLDPRLALALTVGFEHMTAIMAGALLSRPQTMKKMAPEVRALLIWHAIEEVEHKSVAFDVFTAVGGGYRRRVLGMLIASISLTVTTIYYNAKLLKKDRQLFNFKALAAASKEYFGVDGYFSSLTLSYLRYFKPSFHPSQQDDSELLKSGQLLLQELTPVTVNGRLINESKLSLDEAL